MSPLDRWPVASYVVLAFTFSWSTWSASTLFDTQLVSFALLIVGGFGPMVGAMAMVRHEDAHTIRSWLRDLLRVRGPLRWYALALGIPLLYPLALTGYLAATGVPLDTSVLQNRLPLYFGSLVFVFFLGGGQEEFGWRGYMLPKLLERWSALRANLVIGIVWACWHIPLYVIPGQLYADKPFSSYLLLVVALTFVFTWLHDAADGRLPIVMLLHAGVNSTGALVPVRRELLAPFGSGHAATLVMLATTVLVVLALRVQSGRWLAGSGRVDRGTGGL